jgi:hypothetical protein
VVVVVVVVFLSVSTGASSVVVVLLLVVVGPGAGATGVTLVVDFLEQPTMAEAPNKIRAARLVDFNMSAGPRIQLSCLRSTANVLQRERGFRYISSGGVTVREQMQRYRRYLSNQAAARSIKSRLFFGSTNM